MDAYQRSPSKSARPDLCEALVLDIGENLPDTLSHGSCIFQIPSIIRERNAAAYTPRVISIGPLHNGNQKLQAMEVQKLRYVKDFSSRQTEKKGKRFLSVKVFFSMVISLIRECEDAVRRSYPDTSKLSTDDFVRMIILDAIFILELFLRHLGEVQHEDDFIMGKPWLRTAIQLDLILLENQLPYFVLEKVYNFAFREDKVPSFWEVTCEYFSEYKPFGRMIIEKPTVLHFTDLVRYFWSLKHPSPHKSIRALYSVTKLHKAGVQFKALHDACLLDIRFERGASCLPSFIKLLFGGHSKEAYLRIPCLEFDDNTERVVCNIMAFEQCHYPYEAYICNYITLLYFLMKKPEDVDLLVEKKIVINRLGSSATVAEKVNKLQEQITSVDTCFYPLAVQLNDHYERYCNSPVRRFTRVFSRSWWSFCAAIALVALALFLCSNFILLQMVF